MLISKNGNKIKLYRAPIFKSVKLHKNTALLDKHPYYCNLDKKGMKEKLDPLVFLDGIINVLKNRSANQDEIGDHITLTKLADKITQVKKQYLFEIAQHEYAIALARR